MPIQAEGIKRTTHEEGRTTEGGIGKAGRRWRRSFEYHHQEEKTAEDERKRPAPKEEITEQGVHPHPGPDQNDCVDMSNLPTQRE